MANVSPGSDMQKKEKYALGGLAIRSRRLWRSSAGAVMKEEAKLQ